MMKIETTTKNRNGQQTNGLRTAARMTPLKTDPLHSDLLALLSAAADSGASDVHLVPGFAATFRVHGKLLPSGDQVLEADQIEAMVASILPDHNLEHAALSKNLDCSISVQHNHASYRYRANLYLSQGNWCAALRLIPDQIPSLEWLGFPEPLAERLISYSSGMVIVTGVTGAGKSSTLASLVNLLRQRRETRILTIEEPIEYLHAPHRGGMVSQREVGRDVDSFADGLKYGLRQDPDVILVGEIRDRETAQIALTAAETGHLILTTMHTRDARGALTRFVDLFPHDAQDDVRSQLAMSLRSVVSQHLLPSAKDDEKRALAVEVLHVNPQVQVSIRTGKVEKIDSSIQTGKKDGMITLDDDLQRLVAAGRIAADTARRIAKEPEAITGPSSRSW